MSSAIVRHNPDTTTIASPLSPLPDAFILPSPFESHALTFDDDRSAQGVATLDRPQRSYRNFRIQWRGCYSTAPSPASSRTSASAVADYDSVYRHSADNRPGLG